MFLLSYKKVSNGYVKTLDKLKRHRQITYLFMSKCLVTFFYHRVKRLPMTITTVREILICIRLQEGPCSKSLLLYYSSTGATN